MSIGDHEDWQKFCRNEWGAFERIYERHKDRMFTYSLYMTGDRWLSEEIVQDTFLKLCEQKGHLEVRDSLAAWLFICTRNLVLNRLARRKREATLPPAEVQSTLLDPEQRLFLLGVLNRLPAQERELLLLREQHGLPIKSLAELLDLSEENVRIRLYRARKHMQQIAGNRV